MVSDVRNKRPKRHGCLLVVILLVEVADSGRRLESFAYYSVKFIKCACVCIVCLFYLNTHRDIYSRLRASIGLMR